MSRISGVVDLSGRPVDSTVLAQVATASPARGRLSVGRPSSHVGLGHVTVHAGDAAIASLARHDLWLTADVRLDDRASLTAELRRCGSLDGHEPTDVDLLLAAYAAWGVRCPEHLTGDFAYAIWDGRTRRLVCARDQLGIKPFHYALVGSVFVFGSEAVQVLQGPGVTDELDEIALGDHLLNNCRDEERTIFRDVARLSPAHRIVVDGSGLSIDRYWDVDPDRRTRHRTSAEYVEQYRDLFDRAVSDRLRTPGGVVAVGMSGGLDSCSVAATAQRLSTRPRIQAVSMAFGQLAECDERDYSRLMAPRLQLPVMYCDAERVTLLADSPEFEPSRETPFLPDESANGDALATARHAGATVYLTGHVGRYGLSGNGPAASANRFLHGDLAVIAELRRYAVGHGRSTLNVMAAHLIEPPLPMGLRSGVRRALGRPLDDWFPEWLTDGFVARTGLGERVAERPMPVGVTARRRDLRGAAQLGGVGRAVYWYDRAAAQRGMEARHPFLDRRMVEFLCSIPAGEIAHPGEDRRILRRAMSGRLPDEIRLRTVKTNFIPRIRHGLVTGRARFDAMFEGGAVLPSLGVVDAGALRAALGRVADAPALVVGALYFTVTLEHWLRQWREPER